MEHHNGTDHLRNLTAFRIVVQKKTELRQNAFLGPDKNNSVLKTVVLFELADVWVERKRETVQRSRCCGI